MIIEIFKKKSGTILATVTGIDLTGFTSYFVAKSKFSSTVKTIDLTGSAFDENGNTIFPLTLLNTDIPVINYLYEFGIKSNTEEYVILQGEFKVLPTLN